MRTADPFTPGRRTQARAGTQPGARPGSGSPPLELHPLEVDAGPRYVIRFDLPSDEGDPRYAAHHPDPPHDWGMTDRWELARAVSFDCYATAARVLDFDYGRRRRRSPQGAHGRVVILAEEIHDLTSVAQAAMTELRGLA